MTVSGRCAARKVASLLEGGARIGRLDASVVSYTAGPSGEVLQTSQPLAPRATVASLGGRKSVEDTLVMSWRGPRHRTASNEIMPLQTCNVSGQSEGTCFSTLPDRPYQRA